MADTTILAGKYGMDETDLQKLLEENPELAEALSMSMGASILPGAQRPGKTVGPYKAYVENPMQNLIYGIGEGAKAGLQMRGQNALLDALRGHNAGKEMDAIEAAAGPQANYEATVGLDAFGGDGLTQTPPPPQTGYMQGTGSPRAAGAESMPTPMPASGGMPPQTGFAGPMGSPAAAGVPMGPGPAQPAPGGPPPDLLPSETMEQYFRRKRAQGIDTGIAP
jgi:hypothetical protein